ncbi:MAG: hypothetical protein ACKVQW_13550 [Pyrinomonadaceae bacterium]
MNLTRSLFIILVFSFAAVAQSPSKIVSQANKALGGEKVLKSVTSWRQTGTIRRQSDGASGKYSAFASAGSLFGDAFDLNGFEFAAGFNGKSGWMRNSKDGLRTLTGNGAREFQAEALYRNNRWLRLKDDKAKLTWGGTANIDARPANVVILTTARAIKLKLFFDAKSGLLVREELPSAGGFKTFDYSDYRLVSGIQTPFAIRAGIDGETLEIKLDEVKFNEAVARTVFDFPVVSNEPLPDIPALLAEIRANTEKLDAIIENYGFTETRIERDTDKNGDLIEKTSETRALSFYKGFRISRLIEKNGKPLSAGDQEKEDRDAAKQVTEIEKKIAEREKREQISVTKSNAQDAERRITLADALRNSLLINPRRERFGGREVIVFDYEPNPASKPKTRTEQIFALCTGAVWVDANSKQVVRLDAELTKSIGNFIGKAKRGASFTLENELVNNEIWLPSRADVNFQIKILFAGFTINNLIKYGNYKRFETEVKGATVGDQKKP